MKKSVKNFKYSIIIQKSVNSSNFKETKKITLI